MSLREAMKARALAFLRYSFSRSVYFLLLLGAVLVLMLVVVILAPGLVLVGAVGGKVSWLATFEAVVVASSPVLAVVIEVYEPPCDQGELIIIKDLHLLL
ncbi:hypothetical protein SEVIR_7G007152v4 [Setaria viridis]